MLPVFTQNKIYFPSTLRTITPTNEELERYAILSNLLGLNVESQKQDLDIYASYIFYFQSFNQNTKKFDTRLERVEQAKEDLDKFSKYNLSNQVKKYSLDYLIITPDKLNKVKPHYELLKSVGSINDYIIFRVIPI